MCGRRTSAKVGDSAKRDSCCCLRALPDRFCHLVLGVNEEQLEKAFDDELESQASLPPFAKALSTGSHKANLAYSCLLRAWPEWLHSGIRER